jgi:hypothetical protein
MPTARTYLLNSALGSNELKDAIIERLQQMQALIHVSQSEDFLAYPAETIHNYFWLQTDLLSETQEIFKIYSKNLSLSV